MKKHINDKFYTKKETAIKLISKIDLLSYDMIIEPSAGNGAFSDNIDNIIALDIEPENNTILKMNWFDFEIDKKGKILVVGNPPFGKQCNLAISFIKKCDELDVDTIAFILPKSFRKDSIKNKIPQYYHLIEEIEIDDNSFTLLDEDYSVPCVFQIWERKEYKRALVELKTKSNLIEFVNKNDNPDYTMRRVGFYAGRIYDDTNKSDQSHYFIKSNNEIKSFLEKYEWLHNNTTGPKSIGKYEIIRLLENNLNEYVSDNL